MSLEVLQVKEILEKESCTIITMHLDPYSVLLPPFGDLLLLRE